MKVKKYLVNDMSEAMQIIKLELGPQAFIVDKTITHQKGLFGRFKKKQLLVTAAVEHANQTIKKNQSGLSLSQKHSILDEDEGFVNHDYQEQLTKSVDSSLNYQRAKQTRAYQDAKNSPTSATYDVEQLIEKKEGVIAPKKLEGTNEFASLAEHLLVGQEKSKTSTKDNQESVNQELKEIKQLLNKLTDEKQKVKQVVNVSNQIHQSIEEYLSEYDFCQPFKAAWQAELMSSSDQCEISDKSLRAFVEKEVSRLVCIGQNKQSAIHVLVGPPGVGKTTTIAKIASTELIKNNATVGLITVDTYRIGAVEQLKTYSNILNVTLKVVRNEEEMVQALSELNHCDTIIIDSVGRTHKDNENLYELKKLLQSVGPCNCYLVLSMSTKYRQLEQIMNKYELLNYNQLILTKLDECDRNENILNLCYNKAYPISYLCTGQEVPSDIEYPTFKRLTELILGGENHE